MFNILFNFVCLWSYGEINLVQMWMLLTAIEKLVTHDRAKEP